jgi:methyl-accepting chemotaxis protein
MGNVAVPLGELENVNMATICFAMWLQESDVAGTNRLIMIFIGLIAIAIVGMAIVLMVISVKALKAVKDLSGSAEEFKIKLLPMLDEVTALSKSGRQMLEDSAPKVKIITDNMVETSKAARSAVQQFDVTIADVNMRTQRQVARVDGMVTAALTTTAEVVDAIGNGIRVPAQKVAVLAIQAKCIAEGLFAKFKSMAANSPFASRK